MAHSLSAKKRVRQTEKRRARNRARKEQVKMVVKGFTAAIASGDMEKAQSELNVAASRIDKVAAKGALHKNTAARKRSRLAKKLNAARAIVAAGGKPGAVVKGGRKAAGAGTKA